MARQDAGGGMIETRGLRDGDLASVRGLLAQLAEHISAGGRSVAGIDIESIFREMREAPGVYQNWVAVEGERVIGFLSLMFYKTLFHDGGTAQINELIVERDRRGAGVGRLLIERAVAEARRRGMDEIEVGTEKGNAAAQRFYRKNGFDEEYVLLGMEFHGRAEARMNRGGEG
jgi:GNAT superfamily N-acetyltransferase